jgi:hypothetical protein
LSELGDVLCHDALAGFVAHDRPFVNGSSFRQIIESPAKRRTKTTLRTTATCMVTDAVARSVIRVRTAPTPRWRLGRTRTITPQNCSLAGAIPRASSAATNACEGGRVGPVPFMLRPPAGPEPGTRIHEFATSLALSQPYSDAPWWPDLNRQAFPSLQISVPLCSVTDTMPEAA